ncbi:hypothetical protein GCM10009648_28480 [Tsukamurella spumae]
MTRVAAAVSFVVLAAAAMAGCGLGRPEQTPWPKTSSVFDATTTMPTTTAETTPVAATTTARYSGTLPASGPWVSVSPRSFPRDQDGWAYGVEPAPGIAAFQAESGGDLGGCTIGFPIADSKGTVAFLSAGHCDRRNGERLKMFTTPDNAYSLELGDYQQGRDDVSPSGAPDTPIAGAPSRDYAVLTMGPQLYRSYSTRLAPGVRLRGMMPTNAVQTLPNGTAICRNGARSGITCGPLISATDKTFSWRATSIKGDSGSAVFVVNASGEALGVGIMSQTSADGSAIATYLAPALRQFGLDLVLG